MGTFISKNKKWLGYVFFCIIVAGSLLYYRFPANTIRDYLIITANNVTNSVTLSIGQIKPSLPLGLNIEHAKFLLRGKPSITLVMVDSLVIKPDLWSLFKGGRKYHFHCLAYGGDVRGSINFKKNSLETPFDTEIKLKNIHIDNHEHMKDLIDIKINGILSAAIFYKGQNKNLMDGIGRGNLKLLSGQVELSEPILSMQSIEFAKITSDMVLEKQTIHLKRAELIGPLLKSTLSGTIQLKKEFVKSHLNLKGTIEPFTSFFKNLGNVSNAMNFFKQRLKKGSFHFVIHGTLIEPKITFT